MAWVFDAWDPKIIEYFIEQGADVETGQPLASALCWRIRTALGVYKRHKDQFPRADQHRPQASLQRGKPKVQQFSVKFLIR
jgi:hypothetical protein